MTRSARIRRRTGGGSAGHGRPALRAVAVLLVGAVVAGCATKRDLRDLQAEIIELQIRQDSMQSLIERQNRVLADSVGASTAALQRISGDLNHRLLAIENQLIDLQELTGQSYARIEQLRQQVAEAERQQQEMQRATRADDAEAADEIDELYNIGRENLEAGRVQTARDAFVEILNRDASHERAPDAQFQLAETYALEGDNDRAIEEFERLQQLYPNSPRAPEALFRAGVIAEERGNNDRARRFFSRVISGYPNSDAAEAARRRVEGTRR